MHRGKNYLLNKGKIYAPTITCPAIRRLFAHSATMLVNNWKGYKLQEYMQPLRFNIIRNLKEVLFLQAGRKSVDSLKDPPRSKWTPAHVSAMESRNLLTPLQGASPAGRHVSASPPPPNAPSSKGQSLFLSLSESAGLVPLLCDALPPFRQTRPSGWNNTKKTKSRS